MSLKSDRLELGFSIIAKKISNFFTLRISLNLTYVISVIVMCDFAHLFDYMIRACEMDMCTGDYVFLFPSMTISWNFDQTQPWKIGKGRDQAALHALRYLLFVSILGYVIVIPWVVRLYVEIIHEL